MSANVKPIPEGFHTLTPLIVVRDAKRAIEFYKRAFGAQVLSHPQEGPDGKITHASLKIGDSILMLTDEFPAFKCLSPQSIGGSAVTLHIYTENADAAFERAVAAGATVTMPLADQFWGDRYGQLVDPFGHRWSIAARKEVLTEEEVRQHGEKIFAEMAKKAGQAA